MRVRALAPGPFIRDHLVAVGGMDYVGAIHKAYKRYLRGQGVVHLPSKLTTNTYIWLANKLVLIVFDHAEPAGRWADQQVTDGALVGYVRQPRPLAPSPRHYYRIVKPEDPRWTRLETSYRASLGYEVPPARVPVPVVESRAPEPEAAAARPELEAPKPIKEPKPRAARKPKPRAEVSPSTIRDKWRTRRQPSTDVQVLEDLDKLDALEIDTVEARSALEEYVSVEREAFESKAEYQEERDDTWQTFLATLDDLVEEVEGQVPAKPIVARKAKPKALGPEADVLATYRNRIAGVIPDLDTLSGIRWDNEVAAAGGGPLAENVITRMRSLYAEVYAQAERTTGNVHNQLVSLQQKLSLALEKAASLGEAVKGLRAEKLPRRREILARAIPKTIKVIKDILR